MKCAGCGGDKEPTRTKSRYCRACDRDGPGAALLARLDRQAAAIKDLHRRVQALENVSLSGDTQTEGEK